jgi:hypothetical protein
MSIRQPWGGEARDNVLDGLVILGGTLAYNNNVSLLPPNSPSTYYMDGSPGFSVRRPFKKGDSLWEPSGTDFWFHFRIYQSSNNTGNQGLLMGLSDGTKCLYALSLENSTNAVTLVLNDGLGGANTAVADTSATSVTTGSWSRFHIHIDHQEGGEINIYKGGNLAVPILTHTLTALDMTNIGVNKPNNYYVRGRSGVSSDLFDDLFMFDPNDALSPTDINAVAEAGVFGGAATADSALGAGNSQWTGDFTDVAIPPVTGEFIEATSAGLVETFQFDDLSEARTYGVQINALATRTGTTAGENLRFVQDNGTDSDTTDDFAAPGDDLVVFDFPLSPDGSDWTTAKFNATEFGVESRT